jgi:hypothetical protein
MRLWLYRAAAASSSTGTFARMAAGARAGSLERSCGIENLELFERLVVAANALLGSRA